MSHRFTAVLAAGGVLAALLMPMPEADASPRVCEDVVWGILGTQVRTICDGPVRPDGSWDRSRTVWTPAHKVPQQCVGARWSQTCFGGYLVGQSVNRADVYRVTDSTVLPGEPGHLA